jgi:hypothetical protein
MAVDVADINRDGLDDLFFVEMLSRDFSFRQLHRDNLMKGILNTRMQNPLRRWEIARNTLFLNRGDGTYAEIAELAGVDASEWSWGAIFLDVDLDGWEDLLIPTGHNHDVQNADVMRRLANSIAPDSYEQRVQDLSQFPKLATPIVAYRNEGRHFKFSERQSEWGLDIPGVSNGFACADLDNDGDLDLVANRLNDSVLILRNDSARERIAIRLAGKAPNRYGVGAKITVRGGPAGIVQSQRLISGGRYLSNDDYIRVFAAQAGRALDVEVAWPDGSRTEARGISPNAVYELNQSQGKQQAPPSKATAMAFFKGVTLNHRNVDGPFNDYERQPSLPYSLSSQGPALAWGDVDRDGREDLVIGATRGERGTILRNSGNDFVRMTNRFTSRLYVEDQMGVLIGRASSNESAIIHANSNYESGAKQGSSVEVDNFPAIPAELECPGILILGDVDSDGDLDLFVGGRVLPGRYPSAASSRVYKNNAGTFTVSAEYSKPFERVGLVTSAQFTDFNNDGRADLVIALEWGAIKIFMNTGETFSEESRSLNEWTGWWTSVVTGDFNNDGLTDIVAGNWGRNTPYERFLADRLRLFHGDVDGNGRYDVFQAVFHGRTYRPMAGPELFMEIYPAAAERVTSYAAYAQSSLDDLLGDATGQILEINTMDSTLFLNRGSTFDALPLPIEAQFAPVFGMAVADFDNDGNEDLVLGQNLFETRWEIGPLDSGGPLLMRGNGKGGFQTVSARESGFVSDGQQRAVAIADFNKDGRMDVAMSQNNGETRLYENRANARGILLRFDAGPENPEGVGVRYRVFGEFPVRDVQAGGGWLSQNSAMHVLRKPAAGAQLHVIWPGGETDNFEMDASGTEFVVSRQGVGVAE